MKSQPLTFLRILAIAFILLCATGAWLVLGAAMLVRTNDSDSRLGAAVDQVWGSPLAQTHPVAWYLSPTGERGRKTILPAASEIQVHLDYEPKAKGLLWYRTYGVRFHAIYRIANPTPITQTIYVEFRLPEGRNALEDVVFQLGEGEAKVTAATPRDGRLTQAIVVPAGSSAPLEVGYRTRGRDLWRYAFNDADRIRDFRLAMTSNFTEIDFPPGTASPTTRHPVNGNGWQLLWEYRDVISPQGIGLSMPNVLNAGPVAARISFFAPVSLVFFFAVLLILGAVRDTGLHPMNYFFIAAGCFAFQLLFAYLVDHVPVHASFAIAAAVSLLLVCGYIHLVGGRALTLIALPAQLGYMVLFSYSFFFDGLSGLTITIGAILTLAILMLASARVDWSEKLRRKPRAVAPPAVV
jgi:hypothetical protein